MTLAAPKDLPWQTDEDGKLLLPPDASPDTLQRAASAPAWSIWVRASAGSGKTKVLSDRVLRLLLAGVAPNRILGLTFTKAAAAEMQIRVMQRLARWATGDDQTLYADIDSLQQPLPPTADQLRDARRLFARTLAIPGGMRIQTIHAFAQEILRRFPIEANLPPHFEVMDDSAKEDLWQNAYEAMLQNAAQDPDSPLGRAFGLLSSRLHENTLVDLLREADKDAAPRARSIKRAGGFDQAIQRLRGEAGLEADETTDHVLAHAVADEAFPVEELRALAVQLGKGGPNAQTAAQRMQAFYEKTAAERQEIWDSYSQAFLNKDNAPRSRTFPVALARKSPALLALWEDETARVLRVLEKLDSARLVEQTAALWFLSGDVADRYLQAKESMARLDYDDLIARAGALLARPGIGAWVHYKLDGGIDHILVDEAQDTNKRQWDIIDVLAHEFFAGEAAARALARTLFVVGDEKQSIYSFMGSDPALFMEKRAYYSHLIWDAGLPFADVPIHVSFRSAPAVLRGVDAVFANEAVRDGVSLDAVTHTPFRGQGKGYVALWDLFEPSSDKAEKDDGTDWLLPDLAPDEIDPVVAMADRITACLLDWSRRGIGVYDKATRKRRPFHYGDVMVLVRTRTAFVDILVRKLKEKNIPVSGIDRMVLAEQRAVKDVLALLNFLLLPDDDLTLAALLRGPFVGAGEEQLMEICIGRAGSVWESLCRAARADAFWEKTRAWLDYWMARADRLLPMALIAQILGAPCPADAISGRRAIWARLGPESQDPLDELISAAEAFERSQSPSLQAFLHELETAAFKIKREMEQAAGQVRIVTVHSSKGLEAPIVILPDAAQTPSPQKLPPLLWHRGFQLYGAGCAQSALWRRLKSEAQDRQMQEYRRLFYVALTRAADRLCVGGWKTKGNNSGFEQSWYAMAQRAWADLDQPVLHTEGVALAFADDCQAEGLPPDLALDEEIAETPSSAAADLPPLPTWFFAPPPDEPSPPRPLAPSRPDEDEPPAPSPVPNARFTRGLVTHRLLQSLPDLAGDAREKAARRYLASPQHDLSEAQQGQILAETLALLADPSVAPFFGPTSRAEVPVVGVGAGRVIAGQIDRLAVVGDDVWILDYKTNRPPPTDPAAIPSPYVRQMAAYRAVLSQIYPGKAIRCFILWTYLPRLVEVPQIALDQAFAPLG